MDKRKKNLPKILEAHCLWLESGGKRGTRANLIRANLSGANLIRANLSGANLSEAYLTLADLRKADLSEANLSGAYLFGANLIRAYLRKADLKKAELYGANLDQADLSSTNVSGADLRKADLSGADLRKADLSEANLRPANMRRAKLNGANLQGANLQGANLQGVKLAIANLVGANLSGADLRGADLKGADLINSDLHQTDISGACLDDANTSRWNIEGIICTHLVTGPDRKRIDYAPGEFEQKHTHLENLSEIVLNLPFSELTYGVGSMTESAINQHQPNTPIKFKGQEALSDKTTKLCFVVFASGHDEIRKTQDRLAAIAQNLTAIAGDTSEIRQFVEDQREPKSALGLPAEIPLVPGSPAPVIRPAEIERILTKRYSQLPQFLRKVWECIQSSFPV
jgi:uncharacterized protein YjbI with pentapeptide repeats